jgi:hypothetical protein
MRIPKAWMACSFLGLTDARMLGEASDFAISSIHALQPYLSLHMLGEVTWYMDAFRTHRIVWMQMLFGVAITCLNHQNNQTQLMQTACRVTKSVWPCSGKVTIDSKFETTSWAWGLQMSLLSPRASFVGATSLLSPRASFVGVVVAFSSS